MEHFDDVLKSLKVELQHKSVPDFTAVIQQRISTHKTAKVVSLRKYMVAAALLITSLNASAVWYVWTNQSSVESATAIEELYTEESNWNSFLTQVD